MLGMTESGEPRLVGETCVLGELIEHALIQFGPLPGHPGFDFMAATYGGVRLHPLLLSRNVWDVIPEAGLRALPAALVPCDDLEPPGDVDFADSGEGGHAKEQNDYGHGAR